MPQDAEGWRISTFSTGANCVALRLEVDGFVAICNSKTPETGTLRFSAPEMSAWLEGCKAGEFDDFM